MYQELDILLGKIEFGFLFFRNCIPVFYLKNTDQRMYCMKNVKNDVPFVLPSGLRREDMLVWLVSKEPKRPRIILLNKGKFNKQTKKH